MSKQLVTVESADAGDLDLQEIGATMSTDQAFTSAMTPNIFDGVNLFPFSLQRRSLWGELVGKGGSVFTWALMCAWVCSRTREELFDATANRPKAQEEAYAWAESHGISLENSQPVLDLFAKIDAELFASTQAREDESEAKKPDRPNDGGPQEP